MVHTHTTVDRHVPWFYFHRTSVDSNMKKIRMGIKNMGRKSCAVLVQNGGDNVHFRYDDCTTHVLASCHLVTTTRTIV